MSKKQISTYKFVPGLVPPAYGQYPNTVALLEANRDFLVQEGDAYLTQQVATYGQNSQSIYYQYTYDTTRSIKCQRDMGYVIDAVIYDLTYGGNSVSYQMANRFYLNGVIQILTKAVEVDLYTWLRGKITTNILTNTLYTRLNTTITQTQNVGNNAEADGITTATSRINTVLNTINTGLSALPTVVLPNSQNGGLVPNAVAILEANKRFIQEETMAYIAYNVANNIAPFAYYTYNQEKCRRDLSYIIEGYISDLKRGGNRQTVFNAAKYFEFGVPQIDGSRGPEVFAHTFIKNLIENNVFGNVLYTSRQTAVSQTLELTDVPEVYANSLISILAGTVIDVITNGLTSLPISLSNRGKVKFPGFYKLKDILLVTNTSRNTILYNFSDPDSAAELTYSENFDSDFPAALYGVEKITTLTFDVDTTGMMVTDQIQIFVEGKEQAVRMNEAGRDAMERMRVGIPQSMLDADFEYGLQPTKWQAISMMRNYPSVYEIPGSDLPVVSVFTDVSAGTNYVGASLITVTTGAAHGLIVNDVFTIKALAASVLGFSRAEGTFQVATVTSATVFSFYAKSKVGTGTSPTLISSNYTQLRKAGYYTGASVGTPTFNVFSNGQTGTITTSLTTSSGANVIGFTGSAPPVGAPLSGASISVGSQITSVVGTGGTVAVTKLTSTAEIGATSLVVSSTTGLLPGLVVNRGDGIALAVTDVQGNTVTLSGPITSQLIGTNQTYSGVSGTASGAGDGASFDVYRLNTTYSAALGSSNGTGYVQGEQITILGTNLGGSAPANNATITVTAASALNQVGAFDITDGGEGYEDGTDIATTGGSGTGLSVDITTLNGAVSVCTINLAGTGYVLGDIVNIAGGTASFAQLTITDISPGGDIQGISVAGTPTTAPNVTFISALSISEALTGSVASGDTGITYTSIATIEVQFNSAHGFIPGNSLTVQILSSGTNAQLAAGSYYVEATPTPQSLRYTARSPGIIQNTLSGIIYTRPDTYFVHRPFDGGVQLGTGGPAHGASAIRMSKKYIRYQSGKGVMYNTGALFAPSYDILSMSSTGTAVGSTITMNTDDTDHGCQVGAQITVNGVTTSGYNGVYTVSRILNERSLQFLATQTLGATSAILGSPCQMSIYKWHGATVRSGTFDDQNGMFWQYDGQRMAVVKRSSTNQIAGTINLAANSNAITGINTRFTQQLAAGDRIVIKGMTHVVSTITSDTVMTVTPDYRGVIDVVNGKVCKTIDLVIPQENWNLDTLNGSGSSGYTLDVTKMQMIGMQWTWYGAGFIDFMLRGPDGNYTWAHRFRNSNVNSEAYMRTGNMPVRYEVINEGAKDKLASAINATQTSIPLTNAYWFPDAGTVIVDSELIRYTGNDGTNLTGCVRGTTLGQFVAGSNRTFSGSTATTHSVNAGVILVSNTVTPVISHWGSAFMIDGQFDSDRGYLFNYASTGITVSTEKVTAFLIRLAPSVSNAQIGDLGERELLNRAQLLLSSIAITSDSVAGAGGLVVEGVLNPQNYPTDPTKISWTGLASSAAGGQPSFAQIAPGGSVTWSGNFSQTSATVQGAFTTTLTAKSFAPSTSTLTAVGFAAVTQTVAAKSFGFLAQAITATGFAPGQPYTLQNSAVTALGFAAGSPYGNNSYINALSTTRNDFLITNTQYDALATPPESGDLVSVGTGIGANTFVTSVTRSYSGGIYTRIVMSGNATTTTTAGSGNNVAITITPLNRYSSATQINRQDILITNAAYSALTLVPEVGNSVTGSNLAGGTTIVSITPSYRGGIYTRILLSTKPITTSTAGSGNNVSLTISTAYSTTYTSAVSNARNDFLITTAAYDAFTTGVSVGDPLSAATYITAGQTVGSIARNYITIGGVAYTRIVMSGIGSATSPAAATNGAQDITVTITSTLAAQFNNAVSSTRSTFLITQTQYASVSANFKVTDVLSAATVITGSQTVSSVTQNYATIGGTAYALITMSGNGNATSTAGANNVTITATSSFSSQYGSAISTGRSDFLVTDAAWASSGILAGDGLYNASVLTTAGQQINSVTTGYISLGGTSYTRVVMNANASGTSSAGAGNDVTITVTAAGTGATYVQKNFLFFDSTSWLASTALLGTKIATDQVKFTAGTSVNNISTRTFGGTTVYRVAFTQSSNGTYSASDTIKFQFGSAYALPGEQVFSFITTPGGSDNLPLAELKELTSTAIGGRGTFPNGPDVLAINVYKTAGTATGANIILRWGEAQA